ncbi:MAG: glycogen synthase GlgA [Bryobacteraceae bacterium]|jgi:starch synthase
MPKVLMVASEATPFAKTGGLADVIGALAQALAARGEEVAVLMPRYRGVGIAGTPIVFQDLRVPLGLAEYSANVHCVTEGKVPYFLVDCPSLYDREGLYGDPGAEDYPDNHVRFAVLARVALTMARYVFRPNIIHCHDWQAALVPIFKRTVFGGDPTFMGVPVVLTIHNLGYQGLFPPAALPEMGLDASLFTPACLEFFGKVNLLKGGILSSDAITTVSPTYAREIQTPELGFRLDGVLKTRRDAIRGILNGVDYGEWDPATDPHIATNYSAGNLAGKRDCKADLLAAFNLPAANLELPLVGMVSRLAGQKGFDLLEQAAASLAEEDLSLVVLGVGDPKWQQFLEELHAAHPGKVGVRIAYDEALAHKIEAGADIFLMPSLYEPCGLNQIYSLRYGTVPVVRSTGGLDDTIDESTGFKFREFTGAAMMGALRTALAAFGDRERWTEMMRAGMGRDYSWNASAARYSGLYRRLME